MSSTHNDGASVERRPTATQCKTPFLTVDSVAQLDQRLTCSSRLHHIRTRLGRLSWYAASV